MVMEIKSVEEFTKAIGDEKMGLVIVDFFTEWCGPCKKFAPVYSKMSEKYTNVGFYKVNCEMEDVMEVVEACSIDRFPTFCFFLGGKYIGRMVGADERGLLKMITENSTAPVDAQENKDSKQ